MPDHLVIHCPKCPSDEVEAQLDPPEGAPSVAAFACLLCGHRWHPAELPHLLAPDYDQAYGTAPALAEEELTLALWAEGINLRAQAARDGRGPAVDHGGYRLFYLRQAAYLDRAAHAMQVAAHGALIDEEQAADADDAAVMAADLLLHLDLELDQVHVEGLLGAESPQWQSPEGLRGYVRQEYAAWREWEDSARLRRA
ncbi:hypothetical protein OG883_43740 [Streptomyces sp. NBC_01142]|uniref:hypothetical protein n=1 Tax=Streptomyces sp. NBC_01142 TaxID=2975865 RepID=UPI002256ECED|nr:hypothetical protein [Streptomyces sp. NBC_01142]MCX4826554.1 hypothetical protein [Streptomyces sp. NBC_01142]